MKIYSLKYTNQGVHSLVETYTLHSEKGKLYWKRMQNYKTYSKIIPVFLFHLPQQLG